MDRQIVLDTETTGLDPRKGDRLVEIAGIEIGNLVPTGRSFHKYINPERDMPEEAFRIHGLSSDFLKDKPKFEDICDEFIEFIGDAKLVIHNAEFDMKFINAELAMVSRPPVEMSRVLDTLAIARRKHPGAPNSLDALCARYKIDNSHRTRHGALLDSELLAEVYLELMGGRQSTLALAVNQASASAPGDHGFAKREYASQRVSELGPTLTVEEYEEYLKLVEGLGEKALWKTFSH